MQKGADNEIIYDLFTTTKAKQRKFQEKNSNVKNRKNIFSPNGRMLNNAG
jgi:hypothetical protein